MRSIAPLVVMTVVLVGLFSHFSMAAKSGEFRVAGTAQTAQGNDPPAPDSGGRRR